MVVLTHFLRTDSLNLPKLSTGDWSTTADLESEVGRIEFSRNDVYISKQCLE